MEVGREVGGYADGFDYGIGVVVDRDVGRGFVHDFAVAVFVDYPYSDPLEELQWFPYSRNKHHAEYGDLK